MIELKKLSAEDGRDIYELLQEIPKEENGFGNNANGMTYEQFREWLVKKEEESRREGIVDGWKVGTSTYWLYVDGIPVGFGKLRRDRRSCRSQQGQQLGQKHLRLKPLIHHLPRPGEGGIQLPYSFTHPKPWSPGAPYGALFYIPFSYATAALPSLGPYHAAGSHRSAYGYLRRQYTVQK